MAVRTKAELAAQISNLLADNNTGDISEADVRSVFTDVIDSLAFDALVAAFAKDGNPATIPPDKLASGGQVGQLVRITTGNTLHWGFPGRLRLVGDGSPSIAVTDPVFDDWYIQSIDSDEALRFWHRVGTETVQTWSAVYTYRPKNLIAEWARAQGAGVIPDDRLGLVAKLLALDNAAADRVLAINDQNDDVAWVTPTTSTGGLTQAQVLALIQDWAEEGSNVLIPPTRLHQTFTGNRLMVLANGSFNGLALGTTGQVPAVNAAGNRLEFVDQTATGTMDYDDLTNRPIINVTDESSIPTPSAGTFGTRYQTSAGNEYIIGRRTVAGVDRVVDFESYPLVSGAGYQGAINSHTGLPDAPTNADDGKWWLVRSYVDQGIAPFVRIASGGSFESRADLPDTSHDYDGIYNSEGEAEANGRLDVRSAVIYPNNVGNWTLYRVDSTTFVAGSPVHDQYVIVPTDLPQDLPADVRALEARDVPADWAKADMPTGTAPVARLGTGTASGTTFLRGDGTWQVPAGGGTGEASAQVQLYNESNLAPNRDTNNDIVSSLVIPNMAVGERIHLYAVWDVSTPRGTATGPIGSHWVSVSNAGILTDDGGGTLTGERNLAEGLPANTLDAVGPEGTDGPNYVAFTSGTKTLYLHRTGDGSNNQTARYTLRVFAQRVRVATTDGTYLGLTDTPSAFGTAGQVPVVNAAGDALVFANQTGGGEDNVQSNWSETDTASDQYIQNKPTLSVRTVSGSGLTGGGNSADVGLSLNLESLPRETDVSNLDDLADRWALYGDDYGSTVNISGAQLKAYVRRTAAQLIAAIDGVLGTGWKAAATPLPTGTAADQLMRWDAANSEWVPAALVTGDTIDGKGTAADPLVVSIEDVTSELQESISYHSSGDLNYTTKGATVGQIFTTGPYSTRITQVRANIEGQGGTQTYICRIARLNNNNNDVAARLADSNSFNITSTGFHTFKFSGDGVPIPTGSRIMIGISRLDGSNDTATHLRFGAQPSSSPDRSYDDAAVDFDYQGWGEYAHIHPDVGHTTTTHDTTGTVDAYGDLDIRYRRIFDHGQLVGDGNVDLDHLNDDVTARLLPGTVADNQIARYDSASSAWVAEDLAAGISQTAADARYGRLASTNTFSANQTFTGTGTSTSPVLIDSDAGVAAFMVDQRGKNHGSPGFLIRTGPSGGGHRRVMEAFSGSETDAWFSVEWRSGGGVPRLGFGDGQGGGRDVTWERMAANRWNSPNAVRVASLEMATGTEGQVLTKGTGATTTWGSAVKPSTSGTAVNTIRQISQADYDALATPDANTLYVIT